MAKRVTFFTLALVLVLSVATLASAAQNVANTTQKGSLLIFPKILVQVNPLPGLPITDTYITIGNDYFTEVWVKCYWVDEDQNIEDFMFRLTPNQPVIFSAWTGTDYDGTVSVPPFVGKGELKCWAVNAAGTDQISFNHLYGNALIYHEGTSVAYNAWSFTARGVPLGSTVGTGGNLQLTGNPGGYDACPQYLVTNFVPVGAPYTSLHEDKADLTLVPCKQDLRQDRTPTCTKAKFDIWNLNETKYTGAYVCLKCWYEGFLDEIAKPQGFGGEKFTWGALHTNIARFRVQSANNAACKTAPVFEGKCAGAGVLTPFLGLMLSAAQDTDGNILPWVGYTPFTAGADGSGFIYWDAQGGTPEAPGQ
jgi:hypothetical protein